MRRALPQARRHRFSWCGSNRLPDNRDSSQLLPMKVRVGRRAVAPAQEACDEDRVEQYRQDYPDAEMRTAQGLNHQDTLLSQRESNSGQSAAAPGRTISRKPSGACSATGSTRRMPQVTKAAAKSAPATAYTASVST